MKQLAALVGMKWRGTEQLVASMKQGAPLLLMREPGNPKDRNAIRVLALFDGAYKLLGFVKAEQVPPWAAFIDANGLPPTDGETGHTFPATLAISGDRWPLVELNTDAAPLTEREKKAP